MRLLYQKVIQPLAAQQQYTSTQAISQQNWIFTYPLASEAVHILTTKPLETLTIALLVICVLKMVEIVTLTLIAQMIYFAKAISVQRTWDILLEQTVATITVKMGIHFSRENFSTHIEMFLSMQD